MKKLLAVAAIAFVIWNAYRSPGTEYMHPTSGETQRFSVKFSGPGGSIKGGASVRNEGVEDIEGTKYQKFVINFDGIPGMNQTTSYSRLARDGIYTRSGTGVGEPQYLELPLPPEVGRKWQYESNGQSMEREIVSIESVETPDKTYDKCIKVVSKGMGPRGHLEVTTFYAPGAGQVKMIMRMPSVTVDMTRQAE